MNTNPDESTLALWLEDELTGPELAAVESWANHHPEQLAAREQVREWRAMMRSVMPAAEEPPYPDFFNTRILQAIQESTPPVRQPVADKRASFWKAWVMPAAACAGMVLAFWSGTKTVQPVEYDVSNAPKAIPVEQLVYTPEKGVNAELFASSQTSAIIVLNGVAIPDTTDFLPTADIQMDREINSTAEVDQ